MDDEMVTFVAYNDRSRDVQQTDNEHTSSTESFKVTVDVARLVGIYNKMNDDDMVGGVGEIPFPDVSPDIMSWIIEWCMHHVDHPVEADPNNEGKYLIQDWDEAFFKSHGETECQQRQNLVKLMTGANYMGIEPFVAQCARAIAHFYIKGRTPDELRVIFDLPELTLEQKEEIQNDPDWDVK